VAHWKDTLFVRQADTASGKGVDALTSNPIRIRTEYSDFKGKFVMHCHKLQHEDEGMMRVLAVE
jgi:FtsP/CotA-like multicopper oxidase with cupredoxin domain